MISLIVVLAIILSIGIGYRTKINVGFFGISFAYIIGAFLLDLNTKDIIKMWPIKIFFVILAVSIFYNFAIVNGTLEKLSLHLLYGFRKKPRLLPFVIFLVATLIAALGAGYYTVMLLMAPLTLLLANETGMDKVTGAIALNYGCLAGSNFMTSASGVIFRGLIEQSGYGEQAFQYATTIFVSSLIVPFIVISGLMLFRKENKQMKKVIEMDKPSKFDNKQRTNLSLILIMVFTVLAIPIMKTIIPNSSTISFIASKVDIGLIAVIFSVIALLLKLGDEKTVIAKVPWNTLILISGVGMLISVAIKAGTIEILSNWITANVPSTIVPIVLSAVGGMMSIFSSTLGVVTPTLFPIVPSVFDATSINPMVLFTAIAIGAQATAASPFSSGGSLILGSCTTEEERNELFGQLLFIAVPLCYVAAFIFSWIFSAIF